jgi:peptidoglycan/xylan/chitin deacetylase (PgdA/CDA1 family)
VTVLIVVVVGVVALAHMAPFPFVFEAFRPNRSVWRMPKSGAAPAIYLTFDDGPNAEWTPPLLDALREHGAQATFFLIDHHITDETAPIVKRMADEGHVIALHSGTRRLLLDSPDDLAATLQRAADRIAGITSQPPCRLFRPHAGWRSGTMYQALGRNGYRLAGWSWGMWDFDWGRERRADRIAVRLARKASDGDIVVIHDGHHRDSRADRRHAAETVRRLAPELRARGFVFKGMCEGGPSRSSGDATP